MFPNRILLSLAVIAGLLISLAHAADPALKLRFSLNGKNTDTTYTVTVSGRVLDKATGQPIAGARVRGHINVWKYNGPSLSNMFARCPNLETTAAQGGRYQFTFKTPLTTSGAMNGKDMLCIDAGAPGYETRPVYQRGYISPQKLDYKNFDIALEKGKTVRGVVVDESFRPIEGALVSVQSGLNGDWSHFDSLGGAVTGKDGKFEFQCSTDRDLVENERNIPWVRISKADYGSTNVFGILSKGDLGTVVIKQGAEIRGRVVDAQGKGVQGCEIITDTFLGPRTNPVNTDAEGRYVLKGLPGEETIKDLAQQKNGRYMEEWGKITVYARMKPGDPLNRAPKYQIIAHDGKSTEAPDLSFSAMIGVAGKLIPAKSSPPLKGLMVRLDSDWGDMVEADADGNFAFPSIPAGKHRLTAYLPTNLRYDRGIGRTEIEVKPEQKLENIEIKLDELTEARVQILDAQGNPLEGITAGATWNRNGSGGWTEGTRSGADGWALLYLQPGDKQYVRGMDMDSRKLVADGFVEVEPKAGEVIDNLRVTMVPAAKITVRVLDEKSRSMPGKVLLCEINYADGTENSGRVKTDADGRFEMPFMTPGAVKVTVSTQPTELAGATGMIEVKPGETKDLGNVIIKKVQFHEIKGKLAASPTFTKLEGFKVRLDLREWEPLATTDADGNFTIKKASAGKHRLTAYLPYNLRTDRGVGHVEIEVGNENRVGVVLPLETLATAKVKIRDASGKPLEGISAAAWWTEDHSGVFTEGSKSDRDGIATLYVYPDDKQYLGAHDWSRKYTLKGHHEITLKPGETANYEVTMEPAK